MAYGAPTSPHTEEHSATSQQYLRQGTPAFRRASRALFSGAFITFAVMYCTQPLLPIYTHEFHITPATASLSLSATTTTLAVALFVAGSLAEAFGRKPVMTLSLFITAILALLAAFAPSFGALLVVRSLQGIALAGVPAVAMAYLSEEVYGPSLGYAMGMMIGGNALGGLSGRIMIGVVTDISNWRIALAALGIAGLLAAAYFWRTLPPSRHFQRRTLAFRSVGSTLLRHLRDPGLLSLYGIAFLLMGSFVTLYNYIGFRLIAPPYRLSQGLISWIFLLYLIGAFASAWMGRLADRFGRRRVLWIGVLVMLAGAVITLPGNLLIILLGVAVVTFGFFGAHSIASSWVGRRATDEKAQASALYLFFYYVGSSVGGTLGGFLWAWLGWPGVIALIAVFLLGAFALTLRLSKIPPKVAFSAP